VNAVEVGVVAGQERQPVVAHHCDNEGITRKQPILAGEIGGPRNLPASHRENLDAEQGDLVGARW
jgi:hypothetical protein